MEVRKREKRGFASFGETGGIKNRGEVCYLCIDKVFYDCGGEARNAETSIKRMDGSFYDKCRKPTVYLIRMRRISEKREDGK